MKRHEIKATGCPDSCLDLAAQYCNQAAKAGLLRRYKMKDLIGNIVADPQSFFNDSIAGRFAKAIAADAKLVNRGMVPYKVWGEDMVERGAIEQLRAACSLPIAVRGAAMPDSHQGYGLNIGGVLATADSVIPFGIGVDISCMMHLSILPIGIDELQKNSDRFVDAINTQTLFGTGGSWEKRRQHTVMDLDWKFCETVKQLKDKAWAQLGTSGGGNHFCNIGELTISTDKLDQLLIGHAPSTDPGIDQKFVAVMTHSGSRGAGAKICAYYNKIAQTKCEAKYKYLAWLGLDTEAGQEYWQAMTLMGEYAKANHEIMHRQIAQFLGVTPIFQVRNSHNFAWKEIHDGMEVIVHRKGATPAGKGILGVIPGSMADPAYIVEGMGSAESLMSASHGAGRKYSRSHAKQSFNWDHWRGELVRRGVKLLSAGIDEVPAVYKNIDEVMSQQTDLVRPIARFDPKIVKMAEAGEAED